MINTLKNKSLKFILIFFGIFHHEWGIGTMINDRNSDFFQLISNTSNQKIETIDDVQDWFNATFENTGYFGNSLLIKYAYQNTGAQPKSINAINAFENSRSKKNKSPSY